MGIRWGHLLTATAAGVIALTAGSVGFWANLTTPLLSVLSILAAAIFVRLARGVAAGSTDALSLDAARKVAAAMKQAVRALRALLFVIIATMVLVIFAPKLMSATAHYLPDYDRFAIDLNSVLSGMIGFLLAFVFVRVIAVVQSDVDITDLQAKNLILSAAKKQGDSTDKSIKGAQSIERTSNDGYGRHLGH